MANTITSDGRNLHITAIDSNWNWNDTTAWGSKCPYVYMHAIEFHPSGSSDRVILREGSTDGVIIFDEECADKTDSRRINYYGRKMSPVLAVGECLFTTAANAVLMFAIE